MGRQETNGVEAAKATALRALAWTIGDPQRAQRLLALTGLAPSDLRERLDDPATLAALLRFLEAYEPDLMACAAAIDVAPERLVEARRELEGIS
jgi:hypothetical protein